MKSADNLTWIWGQPVALNLNWITESASNDFTGHN